MNVIVFALHGCPVAALGPYGNEWIGTPHLDRLAAELIEDETLEAERVQAIFADVLMWDAGSSDVAARGTRRPDASPRAPSRKTAAAASRADQPHRGGTT